MVMGVGCGNKNSNVLCKGMDCPDCNILRKAMYGTYAGTPVHLKIDTNVSGGIHEFKIWFKAFCSLVSTGAGAQGLNEDEFNMLKNKIERL